MSFENPHSKAPIKRPQPIWPVSYEQVLQDFLTEPECLENCLEQYKAAHEIGFFTQLRDVMSKKLFSRIVFIGNSFNHYASFIARYMLMISGSNKSCCYDCFELTEFYNYCMPQDYKSDCLYIFISKSGESRFLKKSIEHMHSINIDSALVWLVTDNPESKLASLCGHIFPIHVGHEIVPGTKSYINTVFVLYILTQFLMGKDPLSEKRYNELMIQVDFLKMYRGAWEFTTDKITKFLGYDFTFLYLIAKDPVSMSAANLGAISAQGFTHTLTEGISMGLFFHGSYQVLDAESQNQQTRCIILIGEEKEEQDDDFTIRMIDLIDKRAGQVLILTPNRRLVYHYMDNDRVFPIYFKAPINALSPICQVFILQTVLLKIAKRKGFIL